MTILDCERTWCVYALVDPISGSIGYIGKSRDLTERLRKHLARPAPALKVWIESLDAVPEITILREYEDEESAALGEHEAIVQCRRLGLELSNAALPLRDIERPNQKTLRSQIARNVAAMARELSLDPDADQREWSDQIEDLLGRCSVTQNVTSPKSGDQNCHRFSSVESTGDKNCHFGVTKIVTQWPGGSRNAGN